MWRLRRASKLRRRRPGVRRRAPSLPTVQGGGWNAAVHAGQRAFFFTSVGGQDEQRVVLVHRVRRHLRLGDDTHLVKASGEHSTLGRPEAGCPGPRHASSKLPRRRSGRCRSGLSPRSHEPGRWGGVVTQGRGRFRAAGPFTPPAHRLGVVVPYRARHREPTEVMPHPRLVRVRLRGLGIGLGVVPHPRLVRLRLRRLRDRVRDRIRGLGSGIGA